MQHAQHPNAAQVTDAFVADVARAADADIRSVVRRLAGLPVRGRAGRRIDAVIANQRATSSAPNDAPHAAVAAPR